MSAYLVTVVRDTIFGRYEARWTVQVEPDRMGCVEQMSGMAALITDGEWTCRPLADDEREAIRGH